MKVLITGAEGQLGRALQISSPKGCPIYPLNSKECCVTEAELVDAYLKKIRPDVVVHCAAYTAVDRAEIEQDLCYQINVAGTQNVAAACEKYGAAMMLLSTDYVFDGVGTEPYEVNSHRKAINQYGQSKIAAEDIAGQISKHFIIRTSWMFGDGNNFIKAVCRAGRTRSCVDIVSDQIGSPTYSEDLAPALYKLAEERKYGVYHITNEGYCSWAELAQRSFQLLHIETPIRCVTTAQYGSPAKRPLNSRLSKKSLDLVGCNRLPPWEDALVRYIEKFGDSICSIN